MSLGVVAGDCFLCREHVEDDVKPSPLSCALSSTLALCKEWEWVGSVGRRPGVCVWCLAVGCSTQPRLVSRWLREDRSSLAVGRVLAMRGSDSPRPGKPQGAMELYKCWTMYGREWRSVDPHSWPSKAFASDVRAGLCCRSSWRSGVLGAPPHQLECQRWGVPKCCATFDPLVLAPTRWRSNSEGIDNTVALLIVLGSIDALWLLRTRRHVFEADGGGDYRLPEPGLQRAFLSPPWQTGYQKGTHRRYQWSTLNFEPQRNMVLASTLPRGDCRCVWIATVTSLGFDHCQMGHRKKHHPRTTDKLLLCSERSVRHLTIGSTHEKRIFRSNKTHHMNLCSFTDVFECS